jgi:hypothetical protein
MTSPTNHGTALEVRTRDGVKFGKELRERDFLFAKGFLNLNHGMLCFFPYHSLAMSRPFSTMHLSLWELGSSLIVTIRVNP